MEKPLYELNQNELQTVIQILANLTALNYYNKGRFHFKDEHRNIYTVNVPNGRIHFEPILVEDIK